MLEPKLGPRETILLNKYLEVSRIVADFGVTKKTYFVTDYGMRVGVIVVNDDEVLLVRQYRLLIGHLSWEIPGGKAESDETPEVAARRECLEETGISCRNLRPLLFFHPGLDTVHNPTHIMFTDDCEETSEMRPENAEIEDCVWVPLSRCIEMVYKGQIGDSLSIVGLLAYNSLSRTQKTHLKGPPS